MIYSVTRNAHNWALNRPSFVNSRTIRANDDGGRYIGNLTEFALSKALASNAIDHECVGARKYSHDIEAGTLTIDTKAKARNYSYIERLDRLSLDEAHVKNDQMDFECDIYVFSSVNLLPCGTADKVQLVGWIRKDLFWEYSYSVKEGDLDGSFVEAADAGKLPYSKLNKMPDLYDCLIEHLTRIRFV